MKITETDIFNFVFHPSLLDDEKSNYLKTIENSTDAIIFYKELKSDLEMNLSFTEKRLLAEKVPVYRLWATFELLPVPEKIVKKKNGRLAAASTELIPSISTKTFIDGDKEFLIKVLSSDNKTKVFVFSTKEEIVKDFDLIIEPKELEYHMEDNSQPLEIYGTIEIDKIELRFS